MTIPRLEIYLEHETKMCISKTEKQEGESRLIIDLPLEEMKVLNPEIAAHKVGGTILNILGLWHKNAFGNWKVAAAKENLKHINNYDLALKLIEIAISVKTSAHNKSIEALLQDAAINNEEARIFFEKKWPSLKDQLEKF